MQPSRRVNNYHLSIVSLCRTQCVECHRGRIGAHLLFHHRYSHTLTPNTYLLYCRSSKRIGSTKINFFFRPFKLISQFTYGGGFTYPIYPYHEDNVWMTRFRQFPTIIVLRIVFCQQCDYFIA